MSEQWEGCEDVHWDCRIAQLEAELARRDEYILKLEAKIPKLNIDLAEAIMLDIGIASIAVAAILIGYITGKYLSKERTK